MKKIMIFAAFAALLSVASCQKEAVDNSVESPVFTATIAGDSKTTLNLSDGKIAWESTDEITVKDAESATAIYKVASIDQSTGKATFVIKDEQTALGAGPYSATYGSAPATTQTYSATAGKLYMTAPATETNSFTFTAACGLMKLNLTKAGESVKSVAVTGTPTDGSETTYTLNCNEAVSIASATDFCIALPTGVYTKIEVTNAADITSTLNAATGVEILNNHVKPVTIAANKLDFAIKGTAIATIGGQNVSVNWIQLWKNGPKFAEYNVGAANKAPEDFGGYYTWGSTTKPTSTTPTYNSGNSELTGTSDTATNLWGNNWRMPTKSEFDDLFTNCTVEKVESGVVGLKFTGKNGYQNNSIFLRSAGFSNYLASGNINRSNEYGYYWSSTPVDGDNIKAYFLDNYTTSVITNDRRFGFSVRAVLAN